MKGIRILAALVCLALVFCAGSALLSEAKAEETVLTTVVEGKTETYLPDGDGRSNEDLLNGYVEKLFSAIGAQQSFTKGSRSANASAGASLTGMDAALYRIMAERITAIAQGPETSTVITIDGAADLGLTTGPWTAQDLGVESIVSGGAITQEASAALETKYQVIGLSPALNALLADYPYELYWYDKSNTGGTQSACSYGITASYDNTLQEYTISVNDLTYTISMAVAAGYQPVNAGNAYTVDTSKVSAAQAAADNIQGILDAHANTSTEDKLAAYKNIICGLVSYNSAAANGTVSYGDPWQLVYVFDGDTETNVVCEGYSKAFKYLCDKTVPSIDCLLVTGTMAGGTGAGPHMWNLVILNGESYLVDVTNSDTGTVGKNGELFLATREADSDWDSYTISGVTYTYDDVTKATFAQETLTVKTGASSVTYLDENGQTQTCETFTILTAGTSTTWSNGGWYVAEAGELTIGSRVTVSGEAHLILLDGAALTVTGGINVSENNSLTIYAQSAGTGMGALTVSGVADDKAGIGGGNQGTCGTVTVNGGTVIATGGSYAAGIGGGYHGAGSKITVNGGTVNATGGSYAAGIGGGYQRAGGTVTVNGGTVHATGGSYAAGIGGGYSGAGGKITVNGGSVTATGGEIKATDGSSTCGGAGIGGGYLSSDSGTLIISGGTVEANGGYQSAGIGGSYSGAGAKVTISGGTVTAKGGNMGAGIGGGHNGAGGEVTISGGVITAIGGKSGAGIGGGFSGTGGTLTVGFDNTDDYLTATSYTGTVTVAAGHTVGVEDTAYEAGDSIPTDSIANKKLEKYAARYTLTLTPTTGGEAAASAGGAAIESGGTVRQGSTVTVTLTPSANWLTSSLTYTPEGGEPVTLTPGADGAYAFAMPGANVTVSAVFTPDPEHFSVNEAGTEYTIHDADGWGVFCDMVEGGESFSGKTVNLGGSFTISRMAGSWNSSSNTGVPFAGTFNGGGNTLSLSFGAAGEPLSGSNESDYIAPFRYTDGATFNNLTVGGSIYTAWKHAAGIIGLASGTTNLTNCHSSVHIVSSINGDGTHGGFIASTWTGSTTNITGCVFDGSIESAANYATEMCGGFVGWKNGTVNVTNCLMAADLSTIGVGTTYPSATFVRTNLTSITNSYYTAALGTVQGTALGDLTLGDGVAIASVSGDTYTQNGKTWYYPGAVVTLSFTPREDMVVSKVTSQAGSADPEEITPDPDTGLYSVTMPSGEVTVEAQYAYTFTYIDTVSGTPVEKTIVAGKDGVGTITLMSSDTFNWSAGWYVVKGKVDIPSNRRCNTNGSVKVILCDGAELNIPSGINVDGNGYLWIYAQSDGEGMGKLTVTSPSNNSMGIGYFSGYTAGTVNICGGLIDVTGGSGSAAFGGNGFSLNIYGGTVIATGGAGGAGIGGFNGKVLKVNVYGGTLTANGGADSVGIGGGGTNGTVTIKGGKVTASGIDAALNVNLGKDSDSLQSSAYSRAVNVTGVLSDGEGNYYSGALSDEEKTAIAGKELKKNTTAHSVSVTNGNNGRVIASPLAALPNTLITLTAYPDASYGLRSLVVTDASGNVLPLTDCTFYMPDSDVSVRATFQGPYNYLDADGHSATVKGSEYKYLSESGATLSSGWYVVHQDWTCYNRLTVSGDVHLLICDSATLKVSKGFNVASGSSLSIYVQSNTDSKMGKLNITGPAENQAGIGGNENQDGGNITINGGKITVTRTTTGPGISGALTVNFINMYASLQASSYSGTVTLADGLVLNDNRTDDYYAGTLSDAEKDAIKGKTLKKSLVGHVIRLTTAGSGSGTITASASAARQDTVITLTAAPAEGYALTGLQYTYDSTDGTVTQHISITKDQTTGKYTGSFTMPAAEVTATAEFDDAVPYFDDQGVQQFCSQYTLLSGDSTDLTGWYVADGSGEITSRVTVTGDAHLILCSDAALEITKGITVSEGNSLTIYAQNNTNGEEGVLIINGENGKAAIGVEEDSTCGTVTINGGCLYITGGESGAGIGGGSYGAGGTVTINGGWIKVHGGDHAAGIGGGRRGAGGNVVINGGFIFAEGGTDAVAIGSGYAYNGDNLGTLTINLSKDIDSLRADSYGGTVTVQEGKILTDGNGSFYAGTLNSAEKTAIAGKTLVRDTTAHTIGVNIVGNGTVSLSASAALKDANIDILDASPEEGLSLVGLWYTYTPEGGETIAQDLYTGNSYTNSFTMPEADVTVTAVFAPPVNYLDAQGAEKTCNEYKLIGAYSWVLEGWYVVDEDVDMGDTRLDVSGTAHLILTNGATLTVPEGIEVERNDSLTIYAQSTDEDTMGALTISGDDMDSDRAGIGATNLGNGGSVTINGGKITVTGGFYAAGIGGSMNGAGGKITVNGGSVTANGGLDAAGIGGGMNGACGEITVNGGSVTANGGLDAAGIGGGSGGAGGEITVNGGSVTANSGEDSAGIGGGAGAAGGTVKITGGTVTANGESGGAGIGGGGMGAGGTVEITGGTVTANGSEVTLDNGQTVYGAGIGCGCLYEGDSLGSLTIDFSDTGASLTATSYSGTVKVADGKILKGAKDHYYAGTLSDAEKDAIKAQTLKLFTGEAYIIRVTEAEHGTVTASASAATWLQSITITVAPAEGYAVTGLRYTCYYGNTPTTENIELVKDQNTGNYTGTFNMPSANATVTAEFGAPVTYLDENGNEQTCTQYTPFRGESDDLTGWYVVDDYGYIEDMRLKVSGSAHLILTNGATLSVPKGIEVGRYDSLTIYAQSTDEDTMGTLTIDGGNDMDGPCAGIGGGNDHNAGGSVTINGGKITVTGGPYAAGIGGGMDGAGGKITVNGGSVTANGGPDAAGIGGGYNGAGGEITVNGGSVTANGGEDGAGIGGGAGAAGGTVKITGGTVTANGGKIGAGIGGGVNAAGGKVEITGGTVTANGESGGAGIGGGGMGAGGSVEITGGTVTANGGEATLDNGQTVYGAGIGCGYAYEGDSLGSLTIDFSDTVASLEATSYSGTVKVADGIVLTDGAGNYYAGTLSYMEIEAIRNKTLVMDTTAHIVSVSAAEHGTVTPFPSVALKDTEITLTVNPDAGYELDTLTVKQGETDVPASGAGSAYTFTMPDGSVTVSAAFRTQTAPLFTQTALELSGVLNTRFYVSYPDGWDASGDYVVFTVNGGSPLTVTETAKDEYGTYFVCPVNAFQMADPITAVYYHGGQESTREENCTLLQNLKYLSSHTSNKEQALVRATMDFGCYIQPYLAAANGWTVGTDHAAMTAYNTSLPVLTEVDSQYAHEMIIRNTDYVESVFFSLSTYQDNELNVIVALKDGVAGEITGTVNGQAVTPAPYTAGGLKNAYQLTLDQLPANALAKAFPFTLSVDGTEVFSFTASALSYVRIVLPNSNNDVEKLALTALYNYALAAQEYKPN